MNNHGIPKYPPGGMNTMIPPGNQGVTSKPPSVDHLTQNVNKMAVQDKLNYERPPFPTQMMDQNKNMGSSDNLYGAKSYGDGQQLGSKPHPGMNNVNIRNPTPASYTFNESLQATSNIVPSRPPSPQVNNFPPNKSYSLAPQHDSYPAPPTQNSSFHQNNSFGGASPASKTFLIANDSFSPSEPSSPPSNYYPSPVSSAPYSPFNVHLCW